MGVCRGAMHCAVDPVKRPGMRAQCIAPLQSDPSCILFISIIAPLLTFIDVKCMRQRILLIEDTRLCRDQGERLTIPFREKGITVYLEGNFCNVEALRYL